MLGHPLYQKARPGISQHLDRLWTAGTSADLYAAQRELLVEFRARQQLIRVDIAELLTEQNAELRKVLSLSPRPIPELQRVQKRLADAKEIERLHASLQHSVRQIADGLAWRALQFDRRMFAVLGQGRRVGHMAYGPGLGAELAVLDAAWREQGLLAIHNDMTNCLRHGDLTLIRFRPSGVEVTVNEVKVEGASVDHAQTKRLTEAVDLLRTGRHASVNAGRPVQIAYATSDYKSHVGMLPALIARARLEMVAWQQVTPWLFVGAADLIACSRDSEAADAKIDQYRDEVALTHRRSFRFTFGERRMRDRRASSSYLAPVTVFPLSLDDMTDLVLGYVEVFSLIDVDALTRELAGLGLSVHITPPPLSERVFLTADAGPLTVAVPPEVREQALVELLSAESIAAAIEAVIRVAPTLAPRETVIVGHPNEWRTWSRGLSIEADTPRDNSGVISPRTV